ncbi:MAG: YfaZ family outer membrane protein [Granulosicoccus sp.]
MKKLAAAMILSVAPLGAFAGGLDLSLSNETANLVYLFNNDPLNRERRPNSDGGSELALGLFVNEAGDNMVHTTLLARGYRQSITSQYQVSAGMRLVGGDIGIGQELSVASNNDESVGALALGFQAGMLLQAGNYNPIDLTFEGFYAPSITSFGDAERYGEVAVRLQIEIMTRARAYVGYRRIRFDTNDFDNVTLDRSAHFGLSISF